MISYPEEVETCFGTKGMMQECFMDTFSVRISLRTVYCIFLVRYGDENRFSRDKHEGMAAYGKYSFDGDGHRDGLQPSFVHRKIPFYPITCATMTNLVYTTTNG